MERRERDWKNRCRYHKPLPSANILKGYQVEQSGEEVKAKVRKNTANNNLWHLSNHCHIQFPPGKSGPSRSTYAEGDCGFVYGLRGRLLYVFMTERRQPGVASAWVRAFCVKKGSFPETKNTSTYMGNDCRVFRIEGDLSGCKNTPGWLK